MLAVLPLPASAVQPFAAVQILLLKKSCSWAREVVEPRWYFATVFALTLYYLILYMAVHRTREPVPVLTQYSPPKNLSPAALRYLFTGDSDRKTIAAVMLQLAARGLVSIECRKDWYFIRPRTNRLPPNLPPEEVAAFSLMFLHDEPLPTDRIPDFIRVRDLPGGVFPVHPFGGTNFLFLARKIHTALRAAHERAYFTRNLVYSFPAIALSIFSVVYTAFPSPSAYYVAAFVLAGILLTHFTPYIHEFLHHRFLQGGDDAGMIMLILVYVMLVVFLGSNVNQYYAAFQFSLLFAVFANFAVPPKLRVPTEAGRQLLPEIDGYREFLSRVELDRLQRTQDPEWNPGAATENMAYAVALDLPGAWDAYLASTDSRLVDFFPEKREPTYRVMQPPSYQESTVTRFLRQLSWRHLILFVVVLIALFTPDGDVLDPTLLAVAVIACTFVVMRQLVRLRT